MSEIPILTAKQIYARETRFLRLVNALFDAGEPTMSMRLHASRVRYLYHTDLPLLQWASAVCGADNRTASDDHCNHSPEEYAANAMQCPDANENGCCLEIPF